jgi:RNA polymerase sigma-70 factor (ECF subfamily)
MNCVSDMETEERKIIRGIRKGDTKVFEELFNVYYHRLIIYAISYVEENQAAEDIVQEIFFSIWKNRKDSLISTSISSYLYRAVHNRSIQYLRHKKVISDYEEKYLLKVKEAEMMYGLSGDYHYSDIQYNEIEKIMNQTFDTLPEKTREIFRLSRENNTTNRKIAEAMKIDVKTVEYHISKTLRLLRHALNDYFNYQ